MLGVQQLSAVVIGTPLGHPAYLFVVIATAGVASLALFASLTTRDRPRPREIWRRVAAVWIDPPGAWAAAVLGLLLATPVLALYTPVLLGDADSARVIAAVTHVRTHGAAFLVDTQDNLLPHALLGPVVSIGGLGGAKLFTLLSMQALAGVAAYASYRISQSMLGAAATALALVSIPAALYQSGFVPMYPTMLALGYLGGWFAYRSITNPDRWSLAIASGAFLALAPEAQTVGVLFAGVPVLLLVFAPTWRSGLAACARIYLVMVLVSVPRIVINLSEGGLDRIVGYRTDYWITKGYVGLIQSEFWGYKGIAESLSEYLWHLPWRFASSLGSQGHIVLALALVAWLASCKTRARIFVLLAISYFVLAVSVKQVPSFPRYYSPFWPGLAILVGLGVARAATTQARASLVLLAVLALATLASVTHAHDRRRASIDNGPYRYLVDAITNSKGVIGARSHKLVNVTAAIPTWGGQFLTEQEYVTYLTWPSDEAVIEVMERHDIGWVLINPKRRLETDYHNTWLVPTYGVRTRHVERVASSSAFCLALSTGGFQLYQLGPCPAQ